MADALMWKITRSTICRTPRRVATLAFRSHLIRHCCWYSIYFNDSIGVHWVGVRIRSYVGCLGPADVEGVTVPTKTHNNCISVNWGTSIAGMRRIRCWNVSYTIRHGTAVSGGIYS